MASRSVCTLTQLLQNLLDEKQKPRHESMLIVLDDLFLSIASGREDDHIANFTNCTGFGSKEHRCMLLSKTQWALLESKVLPRIFLMMEPKKKKTEATGTEDTEETEETKETEEKRRGVEYLALELISHMTPDASILRWMIKSRRCLLRDLVNQCRNSNPHCRRAAISALQSCLFHFAWHPVLHSLNLVPALLEQLSPPQAYSSSVASVSRKPSDDARLYDAIVFQCLSLVGLHLDNSAALHILLAAPYLVELLCCFSYHDPEEQDTKEEIKNKEESAVGGGGAVNSDVEVQATVAKLMKRIKNGEGPQSLLTKTKRKKKKKSKKEQGDQGEEEEKNKKTKITTRPEDHPVQAFSFAIKAFLQCVELHPKLREQLAESQVLKWAIHRLGLCRSLMPIVGHLKSAIYFGIFPPPREFQKIIYGSSSPPGLDIRRTRRYCSLMSCYNQEKLNEKRFKRCAACGLACYCAAACQVQHWPIHKSFCSIQPIF